MRVGIMGTHWGRVHCGTFRRAGAHVEALVGVDQEASRAAAREEGVPRWDTEALEEVDVVVIAVPTPLHATMIARSTKPWLLCEKPLFGAAPDAALRELAASPRLFVNYAFAFLEAARAFEAALTEARARRHTLRVSVNLPWLPNARHALLEVGCHPLSFFLRRLGPATFGSGDGSVERATFTLAAEDATLDVEVALGGPRGFCFDLEGEGDGGSVSLRGGYELDVGWSFEPLRLRGEAVGDGWRGGGADLWYEANVACVGTFVDVVRGAVSREEAWRRGLFDGARAVWIEHALAPLLQEPGTLPVPIRAG